MEQTLKTEFDSKHMKTAEFVAWLTNNMCYEENESVRIINRSELEELVKAKLNNNDYIEADNLLRTAKKTYESNIERELAQITSKSIRISTLTLMQIMKISREKTWSRSDVIRKKISPKMKKLLNDLSNQNQVSERKLQNIEEILAKWSSKKVQKPRKAKDGLAALSMIAEEHNNRTHYFDSISITNKFEYMLEKYFSHLFYRECDIQDIDRKVAEKFLNNVRTFEVVNPAIRYSVVNNMISIEFEAHMFDMGKIPQLGSEDEIEDLARIFLDVRGFYLPLYFLDDHKPPYGVVEADEPQFKSMKIAKSFLKNPTKGTIFSIFPSDLEIGGEISYNTEGIIAFEKIPITKDNLNKIAQKIMVHLWKKAESESDLKQTKPDAYKKKIEKYLRDGNFSKGQELSEKLAFYKISNELANVFAENIINVVNETQVITFTIPTPLSRLWDATEEQIDLEALFLKKG